MADDHDRESRTLLSRFAEGDDSALGRLVERESPRLLRRLEGRIPPYLRQRIGASDLLQHTVVDLMALRDRFENRGLPAFRAMLSRMADLSLAKALERERAQKRDVIRDYSPPPDFLESGDPDPVQAVPGEKSTPSKAAQRGEAAEAMRRCFPRLPEADREIIQLVDYEQLDYARVAEELGLTVKAVQKRHSRAIARLRELVRRDVDGSL